MIESGGLTRREVLHGAAIAAGTAMLGGGRTWGQVATAPAKLPTRPFGKTGRSVCLLALGTGHIVEGRSFDEAVEVISYALDAGITYVDTAKSYRSEPHVGKALAGRRREVFLATKTGERSYDGAMRELEDSLKQLGTDYLDLWQVHSIGKRRANGDQEVDRLRRDDSVMKAMRRMKEQGVVRLIGFTGHTDPEAMLNVLAADDLEFDAMLFILSAALAREKQRAWEERVLPAGQKKGLGLIAMKVFSVGQAIGQGAGKASVAELLGYVWDRGVPVANVGLGSRTEIDAAVAACKAWDERRGSSGPGVPEGPTPARDVALRRRLSHVELAFEDPDYVDAAGALVG